MTLGRVFMEQGLFRHVRDSHQFKDGYYFYAFLPADGQSSSPLQSATAARGSGVGPEAGSPLFSTASNPSLESPMIGGDGHAAGEHDLAPTLSWHSLAATGPDVPTVSSTPPSPTLPESHTFPSISPCSHRCSSPSGRRTTPPYSRATSTATAMGGLDARMAIAGAVALLLCSGALWLHGALCVHVAYWVGLAAIVYELRALRCSVEVASCFAACYVGLFPHPPAPMLLLGELWDERSR